MMNTISSSLAPKSDDLGRWYWPDPDCECVRMLRRNGYFRVVLTAWLEEQIASLVDLPAEAFKILKIPSLLESLLKPFQAGI